MAFIKIFCCFLVVFVVVIQSGDVLPGKCWFTTPYISISMVLTPFTPQQFTIELEYMDISADPCEDFYKFTCGNFKNVQPLPENESVWDNFAILQKDIFALIKTILLGERNADESAALQKAKAAYQACVDLEYVEQLDLAEKGVLEKLGGWPLIGTPQKQQSFTWNEIGNIAGEYGISLLFTFSITQNLLNANENVILVFILQKQLQLNLIKIKSFQKINFPIRQFEWRKTY